MTFFVDFRLVSLNYITHQEKFKNGGGARIDNGGLKPTDEAVVTIERYCG